MRKNQFAIIGLGLFGASLARELHDLSYEVLGIDRNLEKIDEMAPFLTHAVVADSIDEKALRSLGIADFDCAVVAIDDDIQASIMTAILLKELGVKKVVAKALTNLHGKVLDKVGVDLVIFPERDMGIRVAHQLGTPNLIDYMELSKEYTIAELTVTANIAGNSLLQMDTKERYGCSIVAVHSKESGIRIAPTADDSVQMNDIMVVIGTNRQIEQFRFTMNECP